MLLRRALCVHHFANFGPQDLMKGYISRERGMIVLSKKGAFPGTGV